MFYSILQDKTLGFVAYPFILIKFDLMNNKSISNIKINYSIIFPTQDHLMDNLFASIDQNFLQQVDQSLFEKIKVNLQALQYLDTQNSLENGRPAKRRKLNTTSDIKKY